MPGSAETAIRHVTSRRSTSSWRTGRGRLRLRLHPVTLIPTGLRLSRPGLHAVQLTWPERPLNRNWCHVVQPDARSAVVGPQAFADRGDTDEEDDPSGQDGG